MSYPIPKSFAQNPKATFGKGLHPVLKTEYFNKGMDFDAPSGTPVLAAKYGEVISVDNTKDGLGKRIVIQHGEGLQTVYGHLQSFSVKVGDRVGGLERIGTVGSSGLATDPALHFEVWDQGKATDPMDFLMSLEERKFTINYKLD